MKYVLARLKEPSTYAGLAAAALATGLALPDWYGPVTSLIAAAAGILAMVLADKA